MEKRKIIGYRCLTDWSGQFTKDKIYQLHEGKKLNDFQAFIDNNGIANGWCYRNHKHFEPVYEEVNYELPEKWYVKGGIELSKYFIEINKISKAPAYSDYGYYLKNEIWIGNSLSKLRDHTEITLQQYLNSINNKMESMKIYYLKQEVKLNQEIDFNGLKIKVTQDLIDNNPNLFQIEDEVKKEEKQSLVLCTNDYEDKYIKGEVYTYYRESSRAIFASDCEYFVEYKQNRSTAFNSKTFSKLFVKIEKQSLVLCINEYLTFKKGETYKSTANINNTVTTFGLCKLTLGKSNSEHHFIPIKKINYYKDSDGFIHKFYYTYKGFFNADGNPCDITEYLNNCHAISNEDAYNKQQEIIKNLPEYVKGKETGKIFKTSYYPNDRIIITECGGKKSCSLDIEHLLNFSTPSTKEEYDKQEELQQLMYEAQKRYPVGTKLSKDCAVTLHPNNKTYLVYPNKCVEVHIGNDKYAYVKTVDVDWRIEYKEPVKDLKFYENKFLGSFYFTLKKVHPNLYYQLILQNIADDLNGDWKVDWSVKNSNNKYFIYINHNGSFNIDFHNALNHGEIFFKSEELAQQAIDIMGVDKLKIIFNVK